METLNPEIPTKNRFSLFAECINKEQYNTNDHTNSHMENNKIHDEETAPITNPITSKPRSIKPPPIHVHGNLNHFKLLDALKDKYKNGFQAKYTSNKLKIMFDNINSFIDFKAISKQENIKYSCPKRTTYTVVLKGLIKLPESKICNSIKNQGLNPIACTEIPTLTKYPIYRVTFAPGITMAQINQIRFIERIKIYWEKFESRKPTIQCFRGQAHGHISANCNKRAACVNCVGEHDSRTCKKTLDVPPTCANCKENQRTSFNARSY